MKIVIDKTTRYSEVTSVEQFLSTWNQLTRDLLSKQLVIEEIRVDDQSILANVEQFVEEHFADIETVQVSTISLLDFLNNLLTEIKALNGKLLEKSVTVADAFYRTLTPEDWEQFTVYINGIDSLCSAVHACLQSIEMMSDASFDRIKAIMQAVLTDFNAKLALLDEPVVTQDFTTVGDLITYELTPIFEQLLQFDTDA